MTLITNYNIRTAELISKGITDGEISKIIYKEYGIRVSESIIKRKRQNGFIKTVEENIIDELKIYTDGILQILSINNTAKSSKEISYLLSKEKGIRLTKQEINKLIYKYLRKKVFYDNKNYVYNLKDIEPEFEFQDDKLLLNSFIKNWECDYVVSVFQGIFKDLYINIKTGNEKIDYLIKSIVKDNKITKCEEIFLKQKANEFGVASNIIDQAQNSLYSNNPYLDNIIHIIFDDGVITNEELHFLKEKSQEHNFTKSFVNKRFWTTGISVYLNHLRKVENFDKILKLIFLCKEFKYSPVQEEMWLFSKLNVFGGESLEAIIENAIREITNEFEPFLNNKVPRKGKMLIQQAFHNIKLSNVLNPVVSTGPENNYSEHSLLKILDQEKRRIGSPDVNLFVENVKFRIENNL